MKKENYLLENFTNEFENDIVFARYINYMKKALPHFAVRLFYYQY